MIHHGDAVAALEVVSDHDADFNRQWDALAELGHRVDVPELRAVWSAVLDRGAMVRRVVRELPTLVLRKQDEPELDLSDDLNKLGVRVLWLLDNQRSGCINLHAAGW